MERDSSDSFVPTSVEPITSGGFIGTHIMPSLQQGQSAHAEKNKKRSQIINTRSFEISPYRMEKRRGIHELHINEFLILPLGIYGRIEISKVGSDQISHHYKEIPLNLGIF
ncbi:hypothetical protein GcM3_134006 [Golovinomyces cichoracearum]|uniref:Uncharacterized protein n=1 Tax=Golovinomyces cichoracearum TaxID=62708 RepID=A0A420I3C4_9PEZI|nr:hypothetical protein GcM3_134006 [Golovinomyces cichoracearum]